MLIAVDTEVTGLSPRHGDAVYLVSTCDEYLRQRLWEWPVEPSKRSVEVLIEDRNEIVDYLNGHELVYQNSLFDLRALASIGISTWIDSLNWRTPFAGRGISDKLVTTPRVHETMIASHLVDSRGVYVLDGSKLRSSHGLKELALVRLGFSDADEIALKKATRSARLKAKKLGWKLGTDRQGNAAVEADYWLVKALDPKSTLARTYAGNDAIRTMLLFLTLRDILHDDERWEMYLAELENLPIFYEIEEKGLHLNLVQVKREIIRNEKAAESKLAALRRIADDPDFNPRSPPQLAKVLFQKLGVKSAYRTGKGALSTKAEHLESVRDHLIATKANSSNSNPKALAFLKNLIGFTDGNGNPVPGLRNYRKQNEALISYQQLAIGSRIHPNIYLLTNTTRISQSDPNGQNVSKKKVDGVSSRAVFGPPPNYVWASIDYSQLELRIFAWLSQDKGLMRSFEEGYDFHAYVASEIFGCPIEDVTDEQRRIAKNTNFALIFGGGPAKVNITAGISDAYERFSKQFPNAKKFMDATIREVWDRGYVETADGYPLYVPPNEPFKGVDYRVQGTAGRIIKLASRWLRFRRTTRTAHVDGKYVSIIGQIHDELLFEIDMRKYPRRQLAKLLHNIMTVMEQAGESMGIPTPVDCEIHTKNWSSGMSIREFLASKERV